MQRKDGRWQILIRHTDTDGVRKRVTVTGRTAKETRQKAEEVRARLKKCLSARCVSKRFSDSVPIGDPV